MRAHGRVLQFLRRKRGLERGDLARLLGWSEESLVGQLENGDSLTRENLDRIVGKADYSPEAVDVLLFADELISLEERPEPPSPVALTREERREVLRSTLAAAWTLGQVFYSGLAQENRREKAALARQEAQEALARLWECTPAERRSLAVIYPEYRTWTLAVAACEASVQAAADDAEEALELAGLAGWIAERVDEDEGFRRRLMGYCAFYFANAQRVANEVDAADATFARGLDLWRTGADSEPPLLEEWRPLSLLASLRRDQHRFAEALDLLDQAKEASGGDRQAEARILLQRVHVFEQRGDAGQALAVLAEAAPLVEGCGDPRLAFLHLFKTAFNLIDRECFAEAAELWPRVRELAAEHAGELEGWRVLGMEARLRAGLGERLEAAALFERVKDVFTGKKLPYDAALAALELAMLWLEAGRAAEVRELAAEMAWIFKSQGIAREALAALRLFCEAARREAATVDLARQAVAEVEKAQRSAPRPAKAARGRG